MSEDFARGLEYIQRSHDAVIAQNEAYAKQVTDLQAQIALLTTKYTNVLKTTKQLIQFRNVMHIRIIIDDQVYPWSHEYNSE